MGLPLLTRSNTSPHVLLEVAKSHLENAQKASDPDIKLAFCDEVKTSLSRIKRSMSSSRILESSEGQPLRDDIIAMFNEHGKVLQSMEYHDKAKSSFDKAEKWQKLQTTLPRRNSSQRLTRRLSSLGEIFKSRDSLSRDNSSTSSKEASPEPAEPKIEPKKDVIQLPEEIFEKDEPRMQAFTWILPEPDAHFTSTRQLVHCISLLPSQYVSEQELYERLNDEERAWSIATANNKDERDRLYKLVEKLVIAFINDELKKQETVAEVVTLAPILDQELFRRLLASIINGISTSVLLEVYLVEGLAQLIQVAAPGHLSHDDLIKTLKVLGKRLKETHHQSKADIYGLTLAMSHVLDAMADSQVKGLQREELHQPLSAYLNELRQSPDPYLVYQAAYAHQALQYIPDDETPWQSALRRTTKVVRGVSGVVCAVKAFDLIGFMDGLAQIQNSAVEAFTLMKLGVDGVSTLIGSGEDFMESVKQGFTVQKRHSWYPALRGIDTLIRSGQFLGFKQMISEAPCKRSVAFQWGVCLRLGDLAIDPHWDHHTRHSSLRLLGDMYQNDAAWGQQTRVKRWILDIFSHLQSMLEGAIADAARTLHQDMGRNGDQSKQVLYRELSVPSPSGLSPFKPVAWPPILHSSLLERVQDKPDVEVDLRRLGRERLKARRNAVYIKPQAKANLQAPDAKTFPLMENVQEFLRSPKAVFLLLGDSGAGKTAFSLALESDLWLSRKEHNHIPLHINLPAIDKPETDLIPKQLRKLHFSEPQIKELKERQFILICDGYDESQLVHNLYVSNRFYQDGEWRAKMIITCRSEYLGSEYWAQFRPKVYGPHDKSALFQEAVIAPFSKSQVSEYLLEYVASTNSQWQVKEYEGVFTKIPHLHDLVKNPFLLTLSLEALPRLVDPDKDISSTHITRVSLYDQFVELWLERRKIKMSEKKDMVDQERKALNSLNEEGFVQNGISYLKDLAAAIYQEQDGNPVVEYSRIRDRETWKASFFGPEDEKQVLRKASPITRTGNQFQFLHKSILEYCVARAVFEPQKGEDVTPAAHTKGRRASVSSTLSFESFSAPEEVAAAAIEQPILESPLAQKNFVGETSIIQFLVERVQNEPLFKQQLWAVIERSKVETEDVKRVRKAAANAITILVKAGVQFNGVDLKRVQIPGADLSHGSFDSAQLQEADLRKVDFRETWLRHADLSNAMMTGVKFGELPFLTEEHEIRCCAHSPDGSICAVGLENGKISLYDTSSWEKITDLSGSSLAINSIAFSPEGNRLAAGGNGRAVRLWDLESGTILHTFRDHADNITCIVYSPKGNQIATSSQDATVMIWDLATGARKHTLDGHNNIVRTIAYSPDGTLLASGGRDRVVRLWNVETGTCIKVLNKHKDWVNSIVFSPNGNQIAACGEDTTTWLWNFDADTSLCLHGHRDYVRNVSYSPNGLQIATGSVDKTVRLWGTEKGECMRVLVGHTDWIKSIAYSPKGDRIISASCDKTLRLWDTSSGKCHQTFRGHSDIVNCVIYLPKRKQFASGGKDGTLRLWDSEAEISQQYHVGHSDAVDSIVYSPNGDCVATGSKDQTVRLWDVESGDCIKTLTGKDGHHGDVTGVIYSPDGKQLASRGIDRTVRLWDTATWELQHELRGHGAWISCVVYSPSGTMLATGCRDDNVRLWDTKSGACLQVLIGHESDVTSVVFSPKGDQLASASEDGTVKIWDTESGICEDTFMSHEVGVNSLVYSPNGKQLASASKDKTVQVWNIQAGSRLFTFKVHKDEVTNVVYSPQGNQLASTGYDRVVILWNTSTGLLSRVLRGHTQWISTTVYSPKGDMIATGSWDNTVRIWDSKTGNSLTTIGGFRDMVTCVSWNPDSMDHYLVTASRDRSVRQWQIIKDGSSSKAILSWNSVQEELTTANACIQDVRGLSQVNALLLEQRGAKGKPIQMGRPRKNIMEGPNSGTTKQRSMSNPKAP
ncbi:hypothetical protein BGX27_010078, partial [Mortierella sp. AM989]